MLGTEYNWLVSISKTDDDSPPRVRLASSGPLTIAVAVFCFICVSLRAEPAHRQLMNEAVAAAKAGDNTTVIAKLEAARAARPDYPRVLNNLSRYYLQAGRADDAVALLREMAAMGLRVDLAGDAFAPLRARADFPALTQAFAANQAATGRDEAAWAITDMDGIIEGFAVHPSTLESFFSDVHNRCIWYRDVSGRHAVMRKFSTDADGLLGVFALKIDAAGNTLWASSAALPEMKGYTEADKGRAFLAAYDLKTRRLQATFSLPADSREHVLGDFTIAADGTIYATDSTAPIIWRLAPGAATLEKWIESEEFVSLQGIALADDGRQLYVSDYANGLWRIEVASRAPVLLPAPTHTTLFGIDGIYAVPGALIAVQNGINPQRVIRIPLGADGTPVAVKVLGAGHPAMSDLALGQVINGHFNFVGNAGWALFEKNKGPLPARTVTVLRTPLE